MLWLSKTGKPHGNKGKVRTLEMKLVVSRANKGRVMSTETRKRMSKGHIGLKHTIEEKEKISKANKRRGKEFYNGVRLKGIETKKKWSKKHRREIGKKISKSKTGHKLGPQSKEHTKKLADARRGNHYPKISVALKGRKKSAEHIKNWLKASCAKPNKAEKKLNKILQNILPNEYKLNVKGNVMILDGKVPDFVNVKGKKKIVELFGDYWHKGEDPQDRINKFKPFGWDTLVVWEKELKDEDKLKETLLDFHNKRILLRRKP